MFIILPSSADLRIDVKTSIVCSERSSEQRILTTQPGRETLEKLSPVTGVAEIIRLQDQVPAVKLDPAIVEYILDLAEATRSEEQLHLGVSPRGALSLTQAAQAAAVLAGRDYVTPDDVKRLFGPVCSHRVVAKTYLSNGDGSGTAGVLQAILNRVAAPK